MWADDYDISASYEETHAFAKERIIKKTRKEHICKETGTVIPVGSEALYYVVCSGANGFEYYYTHSVATLQKMAADFRAQSRTDGVIKEFEVDK
tara:strand:- start:1353 stop:1634 length:282 start_codon:yes stop_codon:yes gene_type:complete